MQIVSRVLGGILLSFIATSAGADIIFNAIPSGTGNNVQFNDQPPNQSGTTIFGNINDPNDTLVQFTSTQVLASPSLGQSRIESVPDNLLNNLVTTIPGFFFDQAVFNLDANANGTANISAFDQFGMQFNFVLPLDAAGTGQNFFTLTTAGGELISSVASQLQLAWRTYRIFDLETWYLYPVPLSAPAFRACYSQVSAG
jgi:hypothetical protein